MTVEVRCRLIEFFFYQCVLDFIQHVLFIFHCAHWQCFFYLPMIWILVILKRMSVTFASVQNCVGFDLSVHALTLFNTYVIWNSTMEYYVGSKNQCLHSINDSSFWERRKDLSVCKPTQQDGYGYEMFAVSYLTLTFMVICSICLLPIINFVNQMYWVLAGFSRVLDY